MQQIYVNIDNAVYKAFAQNRFNGTWDDEDGRVIISQPQ